MEEYQQKRKKFSSYLVYNIVSLGKMTGKTELFQEDKLNMNFQSNTQKI